MSVKWQVKVNINKSHVMRRDKSKYRPNKEYHLERETITEVSDENYLELIIIWFHCFNNGNVFLFLYGTI